MGAGMRKRGATPKKKKTGDPGTASRIKAAREAKGLERYEVDEALGRFEGYSAQIEGKKGDPEGGWYYPKVAEWIALAELLGESLDFLIRGVRPKPGPVGTRAAKAIAKIRFETLELLADASPEVRGAVKALLEASQRED